MTVELVNTAEAVQTLVAGLCDPARAQPWCVVSTPFDVNGLRFDAEDIDRELGDLCRIFSLETGELSRLLAAGMPERTEVYGGAARSFPPGGEWMLEPRRTHIRFVQLPTQIESMTARVISDLYAMAYQSGHTRAPEPLSRPAQGIVKRILAGTRAMVLLDSGELATIVHELAYPDAPFDWVIEPGQRVSGSFDPVTKRLTPASATATTANLLQWYPNNDVTLALVVATERQRATLAVHPAIPLVMERHEITSNPRDRVDLLLTAGDVVPVRVVRDEQGRTRLRSNDIDDHEVVQPAPAIFVGGAPWLRPDRVLSTADDQLSVVSLEDFLASNNIAVDNIAVDNIAVDNIAVNGIIAIETQTEIETETEPVTRSGLDHDAPSHKEPVLSTTAARRPLPGPGARTAVIPTTSRGTTGAMVVLAESPEAPVVNPRAALTTTLLQNAMLTSELAQLRQAFKSLGGGQAINALQELRLVLGEALQERDAAKARAAEAERGRRAVQAMMRQSRSSESVADDPLRRRDRFAHADEWVRHEIVLAWIDRLDAADRIRYPIGNDYLIGTRFAESLEALESGQLNKAFKAVVDVLSGYVSEIASRNVHPLRTGSGGADADLVRGDGARCYRAYIEQNTPSARRVHYWKLVDQRIELSRIVLHDDTQP